MKKRKPDEVWVYVIAAAIPLAVGAISGLVSMNGMKEFAKLEQPPLSPPGWLFPIVWTVLYVLMGVSSARIWLAKAPDSGRALTIYAVQLLLNALWTPIFFALELRLVAFVWLIILLAVTVVMTGKFKRIDLTAGNLQFPYILWLLFAAYLNLGTFILNK